MPIIHFGFSVPFLFTLPPLIDFLFLLFVCYLFFSYHFVYWRGRNTCVSREEERSVGGIGTLRTSVRWSCTLILSFYLRTDSRCWGGAKAQSKPARGSHVVVHTMHTHAASFRREGGCPSVRMSRGGSFWQPSLAQLVHPVVPAEVGGRACPR